MRWLSFRFALALVCGNISHFHFDVSVSQTPPPPKHRKSLAGFNAKIVWREYRGKAHLLVCDDVYPTWCDGFWRVNAVILCLHSRGQSVEVFRSMDRSSGAAGRGGHLYAAHNVYDLNFCDIINLFKCRINIMPGITRATGFWLRQIVDIIAECILLN